MLNNRNRQFIPVEAEEARLRSEAHAALALVSMESLRSMLPVLKRYAETDYGGYAECDRPEQRLHFGGEPIRQSISPWR